MCSASGSPQGARELGIRLVVPRPGLCTDNAAMIGAAAWHRARAGFRADGRTRRAPIPEARGLSLVAPSAELDPQHLSPERVARYLRRHGLEARRSLSQNHLVDGAVLERIVETAAIRPGERIVEVGPGLGILTAALLGAGAHVTAVELDDRLAGHLQERFDGAAGFRLVSADFLDVDVASVVDGPWALVANVPYHITSPILHHVLEGEPRPERFVLMVQREVAERVAAPPGAMSYLSVFVQYHALTRVAFPVPGGGLRARCPRSTPRSSWARRGRAVSTGMARTSSGGSSRRASASDAR